MALVSSWGTSWRRRREPAKISRTIGRDHEEIVVTLTRAEGDRVLDLQIHLAHDEALALYVELGKALGEVDAWNGRR